MSYSSVNVTTPTVMMVVVTNDDESLIASPFSSRSKNYSEVSPYDVPVHVAVTNVFDSDIGSIEDHSGSSFLQEVCHAPPCVMYTSQISNI
jgi:hypothetical protein